MSTKTYFIQFDFWDDQVSFNKFYYGVVDVDLKKEHLTIVCKKLIRENFEIPLDVSLEDLNIKVNTLNNIDTGCDDLERKPIKLYNLHKDATHFHPITMMAYKYREDTKRWYFYTERVGVFKRCNWVRSGLVRGFIVLD